MIEIDERYCKGCGICVHFCPKHALKMSEAVNSRGFHMPVLVDVSVCGECGQCQLLCPDFAIFIVEEEAVGDG